MAAACGPSLPLVDDMSTSPSKFCIRGPQHQAPVVAFYRCGDCMCRLNWGKKINSAMLQVDLSSHIRCNMYYVQETHSDGRRRFPFRLSETVRKTFTAMLQNALAAIIIVLFF